MKLAKRASSDIQEGDMTAMIDMVFQLICFFMVVINFSEADQNDAINLPASEMAKAPEGANPNFITMHVAKDGVVYIYGERYDVANLSRPLRQETDQLALKNQRPAEATVIIRADMYAKTGKVQEVVRECQKAKFEKFALRAKEDLTTGQ